MKKFASLLMVALLATATASAQKAQTPQTGDQFITRCTYLLTYLSTYLFTYLPIL
jgi:hypothetical protein